MYSTEYVCWGGHEEIGYYKHCQWILAGGHLTMKIYPAYPGQPLVSSQLFAAPLTQLSLASPHIRLYGSECSSAPHYLSSHDVN